MARRTFPFGNGIPLKQNNTVLLERISFTELKECSPSDRWGADDASTDRRIFYDSQRKLFLKIWDRLYEHNTSFRCGSVLLRSKRNGLFGFDIGFFNAELCSSFVELITDSNGNCMGYVTREGSPLRTLQDERVVAFTELVKKATRRTGFAHSDYCYNNLVIVDGRISLIDFDSLLTNLQFADRSFEENWGCLRQHVYKGYYDFVSGLIHS